MLLPAGRHMCHRKSRLLQIGPECQRFVVSAYTTVLSFRIADFTFFFL